MTLEGLIEMSLRAAEDSKEYLKRSPCGQVVDPSRDAAHALPGYVKLLVKALKAERERIEKHKETCKRLAAELEDYRAAKEYLEAEFGDAGNDDGQPATLREMVEWLT